MTLEEFLVALEDTPRDWHITSLGKLRSVMGDCPITYLISGSSLCVVEAAKALFSESLIDEIIEAADGERNELRRRLLKACGLPEEDGQA